MTGVKNGRKDERTTVDGIRLLPADRCGGVLMKIVS
jgi:hypothetical protein